MIPKLTMFLIRTIWTGTNWINEVFISYCEVLVRTTFHAVLAVIAADLLIRASIHFNSNLLLILGILIGGSGLIYFTAISSPARMAADWISGLSTIAKQEIEKLSNIIFLFMVTIFYLGIDQGQQHPVLLKIFLGTMILLFFAAILPGQSKSVMFFKKRFQALILIPVVLMTVLALTPEAIANRIFNSHGFEKVTGTVAIEMTYRLDNQDKIINAANEQPMVFFDQIAAKNSKQPRSLIGWTQDKKNQYHLYRWYDGQTNYNEVGQEIQPITTDKLDDIIAQTKHEAVEKAAHEQRLKEEQKIVADRETARKKAEEETANALALENKQVEEEKNTQQPEITVADKSYHEQEIQESQPPANQTIETARSEPVETETSSSEETSNDTVQENPPQPTLQLIPVAVTILPPNNKFTDKDSIAVRPNTQFAYQGKIIRPYQSVITLAIINVETTSEKDQYMITAQPQSLIVNSIFNNQTHDISSQTEPIQFMANKDNSHTWQKILIGTAIGTGIGALADGKKGAAKGALIGGGAGTVYAITSHGKKFQLPTSNSLPPIMFKQ